MTCAVSVLVNQAREAHHRYLFWKREKERFRKEDPTMRKDYSALCNTWWTYSHTRVFENLWKRQALMKAAREIKAQGDKP